MVDKILDEYITTYLSITGWTAVHRVLVLEEGEKDSEQAYWDNQQTGIGKYRTRKEAEVEAKSWAECEEIRFVGNG